MDFEAENLMPLYQRPDAMMSRTKATPDVRK
jgi:hypothetical protein